MLLSCLLDLFIKTIEQILAKLVGINLGFGSPVDAFVLPFQPRVRAHTLASGGRLLQPEGSLEKSPLPSWCSFLVHCSLTALVALILPTSVIHLKIYQR